MAGVFQVGGGGTSAGTSQAINYRTEPLAYRFPAGTNFESNTTTLNIQGDLANGKVNWVLNGTTLPNNSTIPISPGQTVTFSVLAGTHGLMFMDKATAQSAFDVGTQTEPLKDTPSTPPIPGTWGTAGFPGPQALVTLTLKKNIDPSITSIAFECTIHKTGMAATFKVVPPSPGIAGMLSNAQVLADPQTPVFAAAAGVPVRFRMVHPAGQAEQVLTLHGHNWQEEPYTDDSSRLGHNPQSNSTGSRDAFGPNVAWDMLLPKAGGEFEVKGDYLYRTFVAGQFEGGLWGVFRVSDSGKDSVTITRYSPAGTNQVVIAGSNTVKVGKEWEPQLGRMAAEVTISAQNRPAIKAKVDPATGAWSATLDMPPTAVPVTVRSELGGETSVQKFIQQIGAAPLEQPATPPAATTPQPVPTDERFVPQTKIVK
jgi:hypothetical protein